MVHATAVLALLLAAAAPKADEPKKPEPRLKSEVLSGLALRDIGPAVTSGRIGDLAVHPDKKTWYVAVASGGVWKTENAGVTWKPIFDGEGSSSIGCVTLDPQDPLTVWVGTGENNSQRSVGYGDGVYKSTDGGQSWKNVGLKDSEHVGRILVHPENSKTVYVAAQGPLWRDGGDRGLYKSTDGGATWKQSLKISDKTGVSDVWFDPRNPDVLYAAAYQRRRHVFTLVNGGPESAIYKSTDAGETWNKLSGGLPKGDVGRIGLAVSPVAPDTVYAIIEGPRGGQGGVYRSKNAGGSWEKRSSYVSGSPQYYQELFPDPHDADRVYSMDVWMQVTEDGGKTWKRAGEKAKHVDNHALWIDPDDPDHLVNGNDGGLYESFDRAATWRFVSNLPVTQFYRVATDQNAPFYNVYGGTQDNYSLGGPARTRTVHGIANSDWFVVLGGDGFEPAVDPKDPNIVYGQLQHGVLVRLDRRTGEAVDIQPQPAKGEALKWNWDSPLLISPHSHTRLFFAAQRIFRSDDRGDSWTPISGDLTRQVDRNALKVMGRVQSVDAVAKNSSTSFYGNLVALDESPLVEGLIYAGADDGLISVTEDGGQTWRKVETVPGAPKDAYVADLVASRHAKDVVYAAFNNHKNGDFKPYLFKSADRGRTWTSIAADLPERGSTWTLAEDHVNSKLLFVGTEFALFTSVDGGVKWLKLAGGMPNVPVRDLEIQRQADDLVVGTFGRGIRVLDDYTPLRSLDEGMLAKEAALFPVRKALVYQPAVPLGLKGKAFLGETHYLADNPPFGATFTYYLRDELKTRKKARQDEEKKLAEKGSDTPYPNWDALRQEDLEEDPQVVLVVSDEAGRVVRRLTGPAKSGLHRVSWDLRYPPYQPIDLSPAGEENPFSDPDQGPLAMPGKYTVALYKKVDGALTKLAEPQPFEAELVAQATLPVADRAELLAFQHKTGRLLRAVMGAAEAAGEAQRRIDHLKKALVNAPAADPALTTELRAIELSLKETLVALNGDATRGRRSEATTASVRDRVSQVVGGHWSTTSAPTKTHRQQYTLAAEEFAPVLAKLTTLIEKDLAALEAKAEAAGAPWTPNRVPRWQPE
ncbi:MAG: glycosyl hydrolase [Vicinamibacteria bacterium]|nr:glycosyl hydrolase [Vicinamibacteria bacterium]